MKNEVAFIGLGRMGKNMILHLLENENTVFAYNRTYSVAEELKAEFEQEKTSKKFSGQLFIKKSYNELVSGMNAPRIFLLMVKAGDAVDAVISDLISAGVTSGDIIIDGGNSFFEDSKRRFETLKKKGIHYIDSGTSGGLEGARYGACLMLGGEKELVESLSWLWETLSQKSKYAPEGTDEGTWEYFGPAGAGHFVKMVHNGVEYGIDQAIGEGFNLLKNGPYDLDLAKVAKNWSKGSVVRGWLIDLLARALKKDGTLSQFKGVVGGGETGTWTITTGKKYTIPQPILESALQSRKDSQTHPTFATKVVSSLRFEYGKHVEETKQTEDEENRK